MRSQSSDATGHNPVTSHYTVLEDFYAHLFDNLSIHYPLWLPSTRDNEEGTLNSNRIMAQACQLRNGQTVLDAGCGLGGSAFWLAGRFGARVIGLSVCESNIIRCRRMARQLRVEHLARFAVGDFMRSPFADGTFNVVWNLESFIYARPKQNYIGEVVRMLRTGGSWVCLDGFIDANRCSNPRNRKSLAKMSAGFAQTLGHWEPVPQLLEYMEEAGFRDVRYDDLTRYVMAAPPRRYLRSLLAGILDLRDLTTRFDAYLTRMKLLMAVYHSWRLMEQGAITYGLLYGRKPG